MPESRYGKSAGRVLIALCWTALLFPVCASENLITHVQTLTRECEIPFTLVQPNETQFNICRDWTNGREIKNWHMSPWQTIQRADDPLLVQFNMRLTTQTTDRMGHFAVTDPVYYTVISYETTVKVPYILQKITGMNPNMHVSKHIFLHKEYLYSHIQIDAIPILSFITIKNKINLFRPGKDAILSRHYITHGDIPFLVKWTKSILKNEIIKSLERYDDISLKTYCKK